MLQKWFARYARAVHDAGERKALYRLYCAKVVAAAVFFALCAAILIEAFIFSDSFETAEIDAPFIVFGLTLLLWFAAAATAFVLWLVFRLTYRRILTRPPQAGEMPEVASYREKTRADRKSDAKALRIPVAVLVLGLLVLLVTLVIDSVNNPDSAEPGLAAMIGIGIFAVCLCVFLLALIFIQYKKSAAGANIEAQTADEAEAIDAAQGRRHKYSLAADKNAASFRYLFPDEALRAQVEAGERETADSGPARDNRLVRGRLGGCVRVLLPVRIRPEHRRLCRKPDWNPIRLTQKISSSTANTRPFPGGRGVSSPAACWYRCSSRSFWPHCSRSNRGRCCRWFC